MDKILEVTEKQESADGVLDGLKKPKYAPIELIEETKQCSDDINCPICYNVMVEPVSLECNHRFCWPCIKHSKSVKSQCPLCRVDIIELAIDQKYQAYIKESFAPDFQKQKEILKKNGKLFEDIFDFDLEVGNHYRLLAKGFSKTPDGARNNQHWTAYVRCTDPMRKIDHLIEKVTFKMD